MRSIGREKEFQTVLRELDRRLDGEGKLRAGASPMHISVAAPRLGGLSTFLGDLVEQLESRPGVLPLLQEWSSPDDADSVIQSFIDRLSSRLDTSPSKTATVLELASLCDRLAREQGRMPVLLIDTSRAMDELETDGISAETAAESPLFYRLRALVNTLNDQRSRYALVVGWRTDFPSRATRWRAQDVVQRYFPCVELWPDFQSENAWPIFARILQQNGKSANGEYPGFCRSGIPVGKLLVPSSPQTIDGLFLLKLLRKPSGEVALDDQALVALCLQDARIGPDHPLIEMVRSEPFQSYVEPQDDGCYVANEELYRALGLQPAHVILAREQLVRRRFEEEDEKLAAELLEAMPNVLPTMSKAAVPTPAAGPVLCGPVELQGRKVLLSVYASFRNELPADLQERIWRELVELESSPEKRGSRAILFLHKAPEIGMQLSHNICTKSDQTRVRRFTMKGISGASKPLLVCCQTITAESVLGALRRRRDPKRECELEGALAKTLSGHFSAAGNEYPAISLETLPALRALPKLMGHMYQEVAAGELANVSKSHADQLAKLRVVAKATSGFYSWSYSEDQLLKRIREAIARAPGDVADELSESYLIDSSQWQQIRNALLEAYGPFLTFDGKALAYKAPNSYLARAFDGFLHSLHGACEELKQQGSAVKAADLKHRLGQFRPSTETEPTVEQLEDWFRKAVDFGNELARASNECKAAIEAQRQGLDKMKSDLQALMKAAERSLTGRFADQLAKIDDIRAGNDTLDELQRKVQQLHLDRQDLIRSIQERKDNLAFAGKLQGRQKDKTGKLRELKARLRDWADSHAKRDLLGTAGHLEEELDRAIRPLGADAGKHPEKEPAIWKNELREVSEKLGDIDFQLGELEGAIEGIENRSRATEAIEEPVLVASEIDHASPPPPPEQTAAPNLLAPEPTSPAVHPVSTPAPAPATVSSLVGQPAPKVDLPAPSPAPPPVKAAIRTVTEPYVPAPVPPSPVRDDTVAEAGTPVVSRPVTPPLPTPAEPARRATLPASSASPPIQPRLETWEFANTPEDLRKLAQLLQGTVVIRALEVEE